VGDEEHHQKAVGCKCKKLLWYKCV